MGGGVDEKGREGGGQKETFQGVVTQYLTRKAQQLTLEKLEKLHYTQSENKTYLHYPPSEKKGRGIDKIKKKGGEGGRKKPFQGVVAQHLTWKIHQLIPLETGEIDTTCS